MRNRAVLIAVAIYAFVISADAFASQLRAVTSVSSGNTGSCRLPFDIQCFLPGGKHEDSDVRRENQSIADTETAALAEIQHQPPRDRYHQLIVLGKIELYDRNLSVNKTQACASCHVADTGFTNPSSRLAPLIDFPGPLKSRTYAASIQIIGSPTAGHRHTAMHHTGRCCTTTFSQKDFYGGNFWDFRATGLRLGNPAAEQAEGPPTNPNEMGNADSACLVYDLSTSRYASFFARIWGDKSFAIHWPRNVTSVCAKPGPASARDPFPVHLSSVERRTSNATFDHFAEAVAAFESSSEVSPFNSKFDAFRAGKTSLTSQERRGYDLFNGKAKCETCHSDGAQRIAVRIAGVLLTSTTKPLFTDQTSTNLGLPKNRELAYLDEDVPDQYAFTANRRGPSYTDPGVGGFLSNPQENSNPKWAALAPNFYGKFEVATLRNVDRRPRPDFEKVYMHNGYLHSLKEVVHFYNTRDKFPHCPQGSPGEKKTCWPAPEISANVDMTIGNLRLTDGEEADVVAFLKTLTDGYVR